MNDDEIKAFPKGDAPAEARETIRQQQAQHPPAARVQPESGPRKVPIRERIQGFKARAAESKAHRDERRYARDVRRTKRYESKERLGKAKARYYQKRAEIEESKARIKQNRGPNWFERANQYGESLRERDRNASDRFGFAGVFRKDKGR